MDTKQRYNASFRFCRIKARKKLVRCKPWPWPIHAATGNGNFFRSCCGLFSEVRDQIALLIAHFHAIRRLADGFYLLVVKNELRHVDWLESLSVLNKLYLRKETAREFGNYSLRSPVERLYFSGDARYVTSPNTATWPFSGLGTTPT